MPNINEAFPSNYLKAADLKGASPVVTMDRVDMEDVGQSKERKAILYFVGKDKGLILNKTNANKIIELTGTPITEEWQGCQIRLYSATVEFQGAPVEAIRVKAVSVKPRGPKVTPKPVAPPPPDDDEPMPVDEDDTPF